VEAELWNEFEDTESLRVDMDEDKGRRYERACAQLVRSQLPAQLSQLKVLGREPIAVELEGNRPNTRLVFKYRDHAGNVHRHGQRLWPEKSKNAANVSGPREVAGLFVVNLTEPGDL
jgi:hypothetical protein